MYSGRVNYAKSLLHYGCVCTRVVVVVTCHFQGKTEFSQKFVAVAPWIFASTARYLLFFQNLAFHVQNTRWSNFVNAIVPNSNSNGISLTNRHVRPSILPKTHCKHIYFERFRTIMHIMHYASCIMYHVSFTVFRSRIAALEIIRRSFTLSKRLHLLQFRRHSTLTFFADFELK